MTMVKLKQFSFSFFFFFSFFEKTHELSV